MPELATFINDDTLTELIRTARLEDLGPSGLDVTSASFIADDVVGQASFVARDPGRLAGLGVLEKVCEVYGGRVTASLKASDGQAIRKGQTLATLNGPMRDLLAVERVALNLMTHLSGVATLTARYVEQCAGTKARICDTRKTLPGLRGLQKYAVACGGGTTHRIGLYDAVLIKDNHLAGTALDQLAAALTQSVGEARRRYPDLKFIEVEVDTLEQLAHVLKAPVDIVLLDNMPPPVLIQAVAMRDEHAPAIELEASGGINLDTVGAVAKTDVDRISVGALTHSAPSLDIGLDIA